MRLMVTTVLAMTVMFWSSGASAADAEIELRIETSKVLSLYYFSRAAMGEPRVSARLKDIWAEHRTEETTTGARMVAAAIATAPQSIQHYPNQDRPSGRNHGPGLTGLLETQAGASKDLAEFSSRITGLMPVGAQSAFIRGLRALEPLHDQHVWKPSQAFMAKSRRTLLAVGKKVGVQQRFAEVAKFYGTQWPADLPITIYLVPVPGKGVGQTNGHSIGAIGVAELTEDDNLERRFAVIFHELCHSLYGAQTLTAQNQLADEFKGHPLAALSGVAYDQLNEGLATAIANGWLAQAIRGDIVFDGQWYNDEIVDANARALYPMVVTYLEAGRTIDRDFVNRAVALFAWKFPDVMDRPATMFRDAALFVSGGLEFAAVSKEFGSSISERVYGGQPISHERTRPMYDRVSGVPVFVLTSDRLSEFDKYAFGPAAQPELQKLFAEHGEFVWVTDIGDGRKKVFVGVASEEVAATMFKKLADADRLPSGLVMTSP